MIEIRPLGKEEIEEAKKLVPSNCCEPDWVNVWGIHDEPELVGIIGAETRLIVEPFYMKNGNRHHAMMAMSWIDGMLRSVAAQQQKTGYEFFVGDDNPKFQEFVESHIPATKGREKPGLYFFRKFAI